MAEQDSDEDESYHSPDEDQGKRTVNIPIYITPDQVSIWETLPSKLENKIKDVNLFFKEIFFERSENTIFKISKYVTV